MFITADHGNDPTTPGTDHTREHVPLLAFGPACGPAASARATSFCDLGQTIADGLGSRRCRAGESFLAALHAGMKRRPLAVPSRRSPRKRDGGAL